MYDELRRKFIHSEFKHFKGSDGQEVEYYQMLLINPNATNDYESNLTFNLVKEKGDSLKLNEPKMVDSLRGKELILKGSVFTVNGKMKFAVKEIDLAKSQ